MTQTPGGQIEMLKSKMSEANRVINGKISGAEILGATRGTNKGTNSAGPEKRPRRA